MSPPKDSAGIEGNELLKTMELVLNDEQVSQVINCIAETYDLDLIDRYEGMNPRPILRSMICEAVA